MLPGCAHRLPTTRVMASKSARPCRVDLLVRQFATCEEALMLDCSGSLHTDHDNQQGGFHDGADDRMPGLRRHLVRCRLPAWNSSGQSTRVEVCRLRCCTLTRRGLHESDLTGRRFRGARAQARSRTAGSLGLAICGGARFNAAQETLYGQPFPHAGRLRNARPALIGTGVRIGRKSIPKNSRSTCQSMLVGCR
jgi:hypothetical protein